MSFISFLLDRFINLLKWPVAVYMFVSLPALTTSLQFFDIKTLKVFALIGGLILFLFSKTMMDVGVRSSMQVIAHEFSHTFFALLTLHKVKHIRLNPDDTGGEMGFIGGGNWLIIIAPYFFPLFALVYMIIMSFLPEQLVWHGVLGYFLAYHIDSIAAQIHPGQTDLSKAGYGFCFMFLPGINIWVIGSILAFNSKGWEGIERYAVLINQLNLKYFNQLLQLLKSSF